MKDRLITIAASVAATLLVLWVWDLATGRSAERAAARQEIVVDRLVVRKELVVSDTGQPWEQGFEQQQIARGMVARSATADDPRSGGVWVRSRLIKGELDDPFDDRFHALNRNRSHMGSPGHISWNSYIEGAWRQLAIIQGESLEPAEMPPAALRGYNHPGRLRFQSFRPYHTEPLTDAVLGQGMMSIGGGGFGGGGLPYPSEVLQVWGGVVQANPLRKPADPPRLVRDDGSGRRAYTIIPIGPQGVRGEASPSVRTAGYATIEWDSVAGADSYLILRDNVPVGEPVRLEGSVKRWTDRPEEARKPATPQGGPAPALPPTFDPTPQ
jgi:hypothetical protein